MTTQQIWGYQPKNASVEFQTSARPHPQAGELLIANAAIGINPVDWKLIETNPLNWPVGHVPGVDGAGIVVEIGQNVDKSWLGKRVAYHAALALNGSFAEFTLMKAERVLTLPDAMAFTTAAALPCPMLTAWQAFEKIPLRANASVLVAGFGAVNRLLTQYLVQHGFQVDVLSQSLSAEQAQSLGVRHVLRDLAEVPSHYFAIYDAVGSEHAASLVPKLKANGHIICIQDRIPAPLDPAFTKTISYHEIALGALHTYGDEEDWQVLMHAGEQLLEQIEAGNIAIAPIACYPFEQMPEALAHSKVHKQKTVLTL
ncbi:alcohol dehydrogenase catalytic domain-containing protein [Vibrio sp. SM6]|uniref:Alcohol dehydrogenase catalytic domain-containing protein n=1 Tax=Vibrio agarilyticus TaxID=2726741 RepID=A0A7X8TNN3_9VIBR|nr:alcohol dehydrogenase catalytic domain-containing protein [Vibrio agarilyticus]NLS11851.1 alcohol dehydrogenase catalytic domain-containing protein [Vibrio agarilyticus]